MNPEENLKEKMYFGAKWSLRNGREAKEVEPVFLGDEDWWQGVPHSIPLALLRTGLKPL